MKKLSMDELNRIGTDEFKEVKKIPLVVVLDNIRSLNNIGSIFRTADAFRVTSVCLCGITATPPHREIHKTALGAENSVTWKYFEQTTDCIKQFKKEGYSIYSIEQTDRSILLNDVEINQYDKIVVIMGNEVEGVDNEIINLSDGCIEIPQFGTKHSLNVSIASGIVIWDLFNKLSIHHKL